MTVDFSAVKIGDRVRLTRDNGDDYTFEVRFVDAAYVNDAYGNPAYESEWGNLEILKRRPKEGYYIHEGRILYFNSESWEDPRNGYMYYPVAQDYFDKGLLTRLVEETP